VNVSINRHMRSLFPIVNEAHRIRYPTQAPQYASRQCWQQCEACLGTIRIVHRSTGADTRGGPSGDQKTRMIQFAAVRPVANAQDIYDFGLVACGFKLDSTYLVVSFPLSWVLWLTSFQAAFGLASVPELITVSGRMLGPPKLTYDES